MHTTPAAPAAEPTLARLSNSQLGELRSHLNDLARKGYEIAPDAVARIDREQTRRLTIAGNAAYRRLTA